MEKLVLKKAEKKLSVEIDGQIYQLTKPRVKRMVEASDGDAGSQVSRTVDLLVECGMPKEVVLDLDADSFLELYSFVNGSKKNA